MAAHKFSNATWSNAAHPSFAETILKVHTTTSEDVKELRNTVSKTLTSNKALLAKKDIEDDVKSVDGLAFELFRISQDKVASCQERIAQLERLECKRCSDPLVDVVAFCEACADRDR
jgi:hypothetical protein